MFIPELLVPIGYFPKHIASRPDFLKVPHILDIHSVSNCISTAPENWIDHWKHNDLWVYSTLASALEVVPISQRPNFIIHAYRTLPTKWDNGQPLPFQLPALHVEPLPANFLPLGFDVVSIEGGVAGFGHSPLSCNSMAEKIPTNKHCLLEHFETAKQIASQFSAGNVEPGPYHVVEVLAHLAPFS